MPSRVRIEHHVGPISKDGQFYTATMEPGRITVDITAPPEQIADAMYLAGLRVGRRMAGMVPVVGTINARPTPE